MNNSHLQISKKRVALLKWLHTFPFSPQLPSLESLPCSPFLISILSQISSDFTSISPSTLSILQTSLQLSKYMVLKLNFKAILASHYDSVDFMIAQLLYVCVHCEKKEDFITKILELEAETQGVLMRIISETAMEFEQHKDVKEVLEKVEEMEVENEGLKKWIKRNEEEFSKYQGVIEDLKREIKSINDQNAAYRKQKAQVLKQLDIVEMQDYLQLYKRLANEYQELDFSFKKVNQLYEKEKVQNDQYKKKIIEDSQFIYFLSNESEQARVKWLTLKSIYSSNPPESIYNFDLNTSTPHKSTNSLARKNTTNSENQPPKRQEKEKSTEFIQSVGVLHEKTENMQTIKETQMLHQKCRKYKGMIKELTYKNKQLGECNEFLFQKMSDLECVYENMRDRYVA